MGLHSIDFICVDHGSGAINCWRGS